MIELTQSQAHTLRVIAHEHGDGILAKMIRHQDTDVYQLDGQSEAIADRLVIHYQHAAPGPERREIAQFLVLFSGRA
jgi:hypothetical protein